MLQSINMMCSFFIDLNIKVTIQLITSDLLKMLHDKKNITSAISQ
jgi:hypothetical protein